MILDIKGAGAGAAQRVVDFICGTVYAMDGEIKSISAESFIADPASVDLTGKFGDISGFTGLDSQSVAGNLKWMAAASVLGCCIKGVGKAVQGRKMPPDTPPRSTLLIQMGFQMGVQEGE